MSGVVRFDQLDPVQQQAIQKNLATLKAKGASDDEIESYLRDDERLAPVGGEPKRDFHAEYKAGTLAPRLAREQKNDEERSALDAVSYPQAAVKALQATMLNVGQAIPGMEAVQAGIGAGLSHLPGAQPMSYSEALQSSRELTGKVPTSTKVLTKGLAGLGATPFLPANPAVAGGLLGYADQALSADPDQSTIGRTLRGVLGAGIGALTGHIAERVGTGVQAFRTPKPQDNILARQAARAESAARLYGAAKTEGEMNGANSAVKAFIAEPDIAERIAQLKTLEQYQNVAEDSPEMLAALARSMSDEAKTLSKGMGQIDPSKPNTLMEKAKSLGLQKNRLLRVVSEPSMVTKPPLTMDVPPETIETDPLYSFGHEAQRGPVLPGTAGRARGEQSQVSLSPSGKATAVSPRDVQGPMGPAFQLNADPERMLRPGVSITTPGMSIETAPAETITEPAMMPSFRDASADFARRTREIEAIGKGMNAVQGASRDATPTYKQILSKETKVPQTFAVWFKTASDAEKKAALEGILGDVRNSASLPGKTLGPLRRRAGEASSILRDVDPTSTEQILRLLAASNAAQPFK